MKILSVFHSVFDILAPRLCELCQCDMSAQSNRMDFICNKCLDNMPLPPSGARTLNQIITNFETNQIAIDNACALFHLKDNFDYMELIHSLKYFGFRKIGLELGFLLGELLILRDMKNYDYIVPVPIHSAKQRERGFNQAEIISQGISNVIQKPINSNLIKRKIYTVTQTKLDKATRKSNVSGAFTLYNEQVELSGKNLLIVDDVLTTGSTIHSIAKLAKESGALRVDVAVLALA